MRQAGTGDIPAHNRPEYLVDDPVTVDGDDGGEGEELGGNEEDRPSTGAGLFRFLNALRSGNTRVWQRGVLPYHRKFYHIPGARLKELL